MVIRLEEVVKVYRLGRVEVRALSGISLEIPRGEYVSIMGPSGSGKSTLMNLIGALDRPTSGRVYIDGVDISGLNDDQLALLRRKKVGFVFQQFNLIGKLTALENVALPMWFAGIPRAARMRRAKELLELVGLGERLHHKPAELSGGERQRVAIARALANDPEIILADEPTGNLDTSSGMAVIELLEELNRLGKTLVVVTHDLDFGRRARMRVKLRDGMVREVER
ncbi:MAG: ABC transporter ATP-binding protein [Euryarchaeota archaeon]|nr:ABC transporter ATP-binding protein [Euryarchaeota archaeon]